MARANKTLAGVKPEPVTVSRIFDAPRDLVFKAWSSAGHMKRWFSPEGFSVPEAEIDFQPGGVCTVCMRSPEGQDSWMRGEYIEVVPPERLVFKSVVSTGGAKRFTALTEVIFEEHGNATQMTVRQDYAIHDENFAASVKGAMEGWRTTLDKLEREIARMKAQENPCIVHATFSIERIFDASPAQVFHALCDETAKARWFRGGNGFSVIERKMDVRPGGRERLKGRWANGTVSVFDALYFDVEQDKRLVYGYEMHIDERKVSVSLATVELKPDGQGTRFKITEQGAYLDGNDDESRKQGTVHLLDRLGAALERA